MVDLVTLGERLVEVHRADDRADVGHREVDDGEAQVVDLVGGLGGIEHLVEHDGVDRHHGVVLGDDLLARYIEHLLHHVDLLADLLDEGDDDVEARPHDLAELAEALKRVLEALRHGEERPRCDDDDREDQDQYD